MDKTDLYRVHYAWIEACQSSDKLTEWESSFISSLKGQLEKKGSLSGKQVEILERIYAERTD